MTGTSILVVGEFGGTDRAVDVRAGAGVAEATGNAMLMSSSRTSHKKGEH